MYLRECFIENVGPIPSLDVSLGINPSGNPKPILLVGKNGTGKTIFLAYVIDALAELAKRTFSDVVNDQRVGHMQFVKITSGADSRSLSGPALAVLQFADADSTCEYVEKLGVIDAADYTARFGDRFQKVRSWPKEAIPIHKQGIGDTKKIDAWFQSSSVCFFPSSRHERPHWLNSSAVDDQPLFSDDMRFTGILGKPLIVESAAIHNQRWIMDVLLDSMIDADVVPTDPTMAGWLPGPSIIPRPNQNLQDKLLLQIGRKNVEAICRAVMEDNQAELINNYRNTPHGRIAIRLGNGVIIPSLNHLSAGQALLFNLFTTIIRYADRGDLNKTHKLHEINGIVLIDEVDAHLHTDLQFNVLPKLIHLFPKVQFILTSHSPLFLLGMERAFGPEGIEILEMPTGKHISTERFDEFSRSFDHYRHTRAFEDEIEKQVRAASKPLVMTEGQTDVLYIRAALKILGQLDLLEQLEIDEVGKSGREGTKGGGHTNLESAKKFLETNQANFPRGILLLYDCDTKRKAEDIGRLFVRSIPENPDRSKVIKGIENLIPPELFEERFYERQERPGDYGCINIIFDFKKIEFCNWICQERQNPEDFRHFGSLLVPILRAFLASGINPVA